GAPTDRQPTAPPAADVLDLGRIQLRVLVEAHGAVARKTSAIAVAGDRPVDRFTWRRDCSNSTEKEGDVPNTESEKPMYIRNTENDWTEEEVQALRDLAAENTPTRLIGLKLGRTEDAVYAKAEAEGISLMPANQPSRSY